MLADVIDSVSSVIRIRLQYVSIDVIYFANRPIWRHHAGIALILSLGLLFTATACADDESATRPSTSESAATPTSVLEGVEIVETIPPTLEGDEPKPLNSDGPQRGGVLAAPMSWCQIPDPAIDGAVEASSINHLPLAPEIHAGLFKLSDDPNAPVQLELAASYDTRENGEVYEFLLRQDLKFSDGSPLTASDVKWSWERALNKSVIAGRARDVFGFVEGVDAVANGESEDLTGVSVIDDRTLDVRLTQPRAEFIALVADPVASVLSKDNVLLWAAEWENPGGYIEEGRWDPSNMPVGAGPFKLIDYWNASEPGRCAIARNVHYWGRQAYLEGVWFRTAAMKRETETSGAGFSVFVSTDPLAFASEETDFEDMGYIGGFNEEDAIELTEVDGAEEFEYPHAPTISFLVLNPAAPPFDDVHFRRAVVASADVEAIIWSQSEIRRLITADLTTLELPDIHPKFDLELSKMEFAKSKYAEQEQEWDVGYLGPDTFGILYEVEELFAMWREALNLNVDEEEWDRGVLDEFEGRYNNNYHFRIFHEVPAFPDPVAVLRAITAPFGEIAKAPEFVEIEDMLTAAATELDTVKRHEMYLEIEEHLAEQALVIPIEVIEGSDSYRVHPWVHDLDPPKYPGSTFHNVWLDERAPVRELPKP